MARSPAQSHGQDALPSINLAASGMPPSFVFQFLEFRDMVTSDDRHRLGRG